MRLLNAEQTRGLLPYQELADTIGRVLELRKQGVATAPDRTVIPLPEGACLILMPATDGELAITKLVTVHPENIGRQIPTVQSEVLVMDARTGTRLALLDGNTLTARRTPALSLLAAQRLAPKKEGPLLLIGAGVQGRGHLEAFGEGLGVREFYIYDKFIKAAQSLAEYASARGYTARALEDPGSVVSDVHLIVTATTSTAPIFPDRVRDDAFVAGVGAFTPEMAELPPSLINRARVYVDTVEGTMAEAGDLIQAGVDWKTVTPLQDVSASPAESKGPVVFKTVGHALFDLAAAQLALRNLG